MGVSTTEFRLLRQDRSGSNTSAAVYCCVTSLKLINISEPHSGPQLNDDNNRSLTNKTVQMK